jgi:glycosyltransferase involved in cell wall biosynthesis
VHICFITNQGIQSAAGAKRATGMAEPLIRDGHVVTIIAWDTPDNAERFQMECPGARIEWVKPNEPWYIEVFEKHRVLARIRPDLIYVCQFGARNCVMPLLLKRVAPHCKIIIESCELMSECVTGNCERRLLTSLKNKFFEKVALKCCDGFICASQYLKTFYQCEMEKKHIHKSCLYHPYAYNSSTFRVNDELLADIREKYKCENSIIYMGAITKNYGARLMLDAAIELKKRGVKFKWHNIGVKWQFVEELEKIVKEIEMSEYFLFHGYQPEEDLASWCALADAFVAPLNNTVQDIARCPSKVYMYLAMEKPIVTCHLGDPLDLLGNDGFYYTPQDATSMADSIEKALEASHSGWLPKATVKENHTWQTRTEEFMNWFSQEIQSPY